MHGSWVSHASCLFFKPLDSLQSCWGSLLAWWHLKEVKGLNFRLFPRVMKLEFTF